MDVKFITSKELNTNPNHPSAAPNQKIRKNQDVIHHVNFKGLKNINDLILVAEKI